MNLSASQKQTIKTNFIKNTSATCVYTKKKFKKVWIPKIDRINEKGSKKVWIPKNSN